MRELMIGGHRIADDEPAFVVAEIGCNHQGSVQTACELMRAAAECGCDAVKFQKRDLDWWAERDPKWNEPYHSEHAFGPTYGDHRAALEFGADEYEFLKLRAENLGLMFLATAFDVPSVGFLSDLGVPALKIASASIVNRPLLEAAAFTGLPLIVSTGGATVQEVDDAQRLIYYNPHHPPLALMHCVSSYPCEARDMQLRVIESLRASYPETVIGLSDHYSGILTGPLGWMLGARIFEKHFTLHRGWKGSDQAWSLEPHGLRSLVRDLKRTRESLGDGVKRRLDIEVAPLVKMGRTDLLEVAP
jgi:N-acetylneuraminate synthase/sialic acid synthase